MYCAFSVTLFAGIVKEMVALVVSTSADRPVTFQPVKVYPSFSSAVKLSFSPATCSVDLSSTVRVYFDSDTV